MKKTVKYEARLNRNIKRTPYGVNRTYKRGTVICDFTEKQFLKLTKANISKQTDLSICEGHGVYEYFDLENDIEFFRVEIVVTKKEKLVKLN